MVDGVDLTSSEGVLAMDLDKGWLLPSLFLLYRYISKIRKCICYNLTNQNKIKARLLSTYNPPNML